MVDVEWYVVSCTNGTWCQILVYVCTYIHTYIHTYMLHTYIHICLYILYVYVHRPTCKYTYMYGCMDVWMGGCMYTCISSNIQTPKIMKIQSKIRKIETRLCQNYYCLTKLWTLSQRSGSGLTHSRNVGLLRQAGWAFYRRGLSRDLWIFIGIPAAYALSRHSSSWDQPLQGSQPGSAYPLARHQSSIRA